MLSPIINPFNCDLRKSFGVYRIVNTISGKIYIGSTIRNFAERFKNHRCYLRNGTHKNPHLQSAWNVDTELAFIFEVIEIISDKNTVLEREQHHLNLIPMNNRYNLGAIVENPMLGRTHSSQAKEKISSGNRGLRRSEATKMKISQSKRGKPLSDTTMKAAFEKNKGRALSEEHKAKLSKALTGKKKPYDMHGEQNNFSKLTENDVREIRRLLEQKVKHSEIANRFGVKESTISAIKHKRNWKHVN